MDDHNEHVEQAPTPARSQFAGGRIEVRLDASSGERRFAVATATDGRITGFEGGGAEDPTLRTETSGSTFCGIVTAEDRSSAFVDAYDSGAIEVSGVGTVNAVTVGAGKFGVTISRVPSGIFLVGQAGSTRACGIKGAGRCRSVDGSPTYAPVYDWTSVSSSR